jgi:hypothetical protein
VTQPCVEGWEALRRDPVPDLLDDRRPGVRARVLTDLMGRPPNSPAVRRARSGANAVEPVASLLRDLWPEGTWCGRRPRWHGVGEGWRLVEAAAWGADPDCPRLQAGWRVALDGLDQDGGWRPRSTPAPPSTAFTARLLESCAPVLGWDSDRRVAEAAAWLEETASWDGPAVTGVSVLGAMATSGVSRPRLRGRAVQSLLDGLAGGTISSRYGFPNRRRTDAVEVLSRLAEAGEPYAACMKPVLQRLQRRQSAAGTWGMLDDDPWSPAVPVTSRAVTALLRYACAAGLPRLFPARPTARRPGAS